MANPTSYVLDGETTEFEFNEIVQTVDDVFVEVDGVDVPQPGNWTVSGLGGAPGITITYEDAADAANVGLTLVITRRAVAEAIEDFTTGANSGTKIQNEFNHVYAVLADDGDEIDALQIDMAAAESDIDDLETAMAAAESDIDDLEANALLASGGVWLGEGLRLTDLATPTDAQLNNAATVAYVLSKISGSGNVPGVALADVGLPLVASDDDPDTWGWAQLGAAGIATDAVTTAKILARNVTFAKVVAIATARLLGRTTAGSGDVEELSLGGDLEFSGSTLRGKAYTGDVTKAAGGTALTIANGAVETAMLGPVGSFKLYASNASGAPKEAAFEREQIAISGLNNALGSYTDFPVGGSHQQMIALSPGVFSGTGAPAIGDYEFYPLTNSSGRVDNIRVVRIATNGAPDAGSIITMQVAWLNTNP